MVFGDVLSEREYLFGVAKMDFHQRICLLY